MELDATAIVIPDRQRTTPPTIDAQFIASVNRKLINPIVLRRNGETPTLVAGFRRLTALISGGTTVLSENVHFRFFEDLDPNEAKIIELEENIKREDLHWRDHVSAVSQLHEMLKTNNPDWSTEKIAIHLNYDLATFYKVIMVSKNLNSPALAEATGIRPAYAILQSISDRRAAAIVQDISKTATQIFTPQALPPSESTISSFASTVAPERSEVLDPLRLPPKPAPEITPAVLSLDFRLWAPTYIGPKFTLIHCDFPYGVPYEAFADSIQQPTFGYDNSKELFFNLLECLCTNVDRLASYSSHLVFWFHMNYYNEVRARLTEAGYFVHRRPLVWAKSDNSGIVPGQNKQYPRWTYETAFLASRGSRPVIKAVADHYSAPIASSPLHPTQKPEPVLVHFFEMLVDETTDMFDPTCGSATALRAAERLGARSVLGLEIDPEYARTAEAETQRARALRQLHP